MSEELMEWYNAVPYAEIKNIIRDRMSVMAREYVGIGFYLRRVRDNEMYLEDGYTDVHEFAAAEFGMSRSTVNHCIRINEQFSVGGNSPTIDSRYKDFNKSQLQEMLYLSADKLDEVTPDMTVKEIRNMKNDLLDVEPKTDDQIPGQMSIEDYPECMPEDESGTNGSDQNVNLRKPTQEEKNILAAFARKLIRDNRQYFVEDFARRVTDVTTSGALLYQHLGFHLTWYFKDLEDHLYHINLFEGYIQLWSESGLESGCIGDFDWFYLMAQVQSQWNIVAMEEADKQLREQSESVADGNVIKTDDCVIKPDESVIKADENVIEAEVQQDPEEDDESREIYLQESADLDELTFSQIAIRDYLEEEEQTLSEYEKVNAEDGGLPLNLMMRQRMLVKALRLLMENEAVSEEDEDNEPEEQEEPKTVQPDLPILKNNDQRKAFLDNYQTWPVWFEVPEASEVYHRFDLPDGSSIVICRYNIYYEWKEKYTDESPHGIATREYLLKP